MPYKQKDNSMLKFLFCISTALIAHLSALAYDEVLYWIVDDSAVVHYNDGTSLSMPMLVPEAVDTTLAARVRVVGGGLTEDVFLNVYIGDGEAWSSELGIDFDDSGSGYWGVGNPTGIQSPLTGGMSPSLPYISENTPEYSFIIEIGNYDWNEDNWTTVAHSQPYTHSELLTQSYIHETFDMNPPGLQIWNPHNYYAVPEPNSSILTLIGMSFFALKRKQSKNDLHI